MFCATCGESSGICTSHHFTDSKHWLQVCPNNDRKNVSGMDEVLTKGQEVTLTSSRSRLCTEELSEAQRVMLDSALQGPSFPGWRARG